MKPEGWQTNELGSFCLAEKLYNPKYNSEYLEYYKTEGNWSFFRSIYNLT
jgi:hypothetical protein